MDGHPCAAFIESRPRLSIGWRSPEVLAIALPRVLMGASKFPHQYAHCVAEMVATPVM